VDAQVDLIGMELLVLLAQQLKIGMLHQEFVDVP